MSPEQYEEICFQIITFAGEARSCFVEALRHAKDAEDVYKRQGVDLVVDGGFVCW